MRAHEPSAQRASTDELRARFQKLDADASGTVDRHEYEAGFILDVLAAKTDPSKLFELADTDCNHTIDSHEFETAVRALGILPADTASESIALAFEAIDDDGSGNIDWKELKLKLAPDTIGERKARARQYVWRSSTVRDRAAAQGVTPVYVDSDITRKPTKLLDPRGGRKYHLFVSPHNDGAEGMLDELQRERKLAKLRWTANFEELVQCEQMLVYLRSDTWAAQNRDAFAKQLREALDRKMLLLLTHETPGFGQEERKGNTFEQLTASTPQELLNRRIYARISTPLMGGFYRLASLALLDESISSVKLGKPVAMKPLTDLMSVTGTVTRALGAGISEKNQAEARTTWAGNGRKG